MPGRAAACGPGSYFGLQLWRYCKDIQVNQCYSQTTSGSAIVRGDEIADVHQER